MARTDNHSHTKENEARQNRSEPGDETCRAGVLTLPPIIEHLQQIDLAARNKICKAYPVETIRAAGYVGNVLAALFSQ